MPQLRPLRQTLQPPTPLRPIPFLSPIPIPMQLHQLPNRPRQSKNFLLGSTALAWLLTSAGLLAQAPDASGAQKPVFEEWVVVVLDGKTCGFGSTLTTKTDTAS